LSKQLRNILILLGVLTLISFGALFIGSESLPFETVLETLWGEQANKTHRFIILDIRLPRILTALLTGVGLSIAGLMMQTYFRNSLAGPSILGVTSGASLGVALITMSSTLFGLSFFNNGYSIALASVIGSISVLFLILIIASRIGNGIILLILGVILSSFIGATVTILQYFTDAESIQKYILWTMGSTNSTTLFDTGILSVIVVIGVLLTLFLIKPLNALLIGEEYAESLGVNVIKSRYLIIFSTGILTGGITAFCGPIAFIGLAVPHLVKIKTKTSNHNFLIPLTGLTGGIVMVIADSIAQFPFSELQLPINAVTSLIAAPIIIYVILKQRNFHGA
jgi:iron complex transport system permease protein